MNEHIAHFFANEKIEFFSVIDYSYLRETKPYLINKAGITPHSCIIFLIPYFSGYPKNFSAYAAPRDYHLYVKSVTERLISVLKEEYPEGSFVGFGDHSPIDERAAVCSAGLGILGKNGLVINKKYGSYVFIAEIVTDVTPSEIGAVAALPPAYCMDCGACARACPTGILRGESCDCLSAITQKKGELSERDIELMRSCGTVWGCDICQKVCPYNLTAEQTPIEFFKEQRVEELTLDGVEKMSDAEFSERAFSWRGREVVLRNLRLAESRGKRD